MLEKVKKKELFPVVLAPMEDISDPPFRRICRSMGADWVFTEFISSEGLIRNAEKSMIKLDIANEERPVAIQLFGHDPQNMAMAAEIAENAAPDFIDLNFGCPVKKVVRKNAGAALLKDLHLMEKIALNVVKSTKIPVTAKTRLGWDNSSINILETIKILQECGVQAISVHARTARQMYGGKADWSYFEKIMAIPGLLVPIIANGDINSAENALYMKQNYQIHGVMIGRASIGNPWIFKEIKAFLAGETKISKTSPEEKIRICRQHLIDSVAWKGEMLALNEMKKHYKYYFRDFESIKKNRIRLFSAKSQSEALDILDEIAASATI
jgi:tRNA-dihydrouridine synthase B